MFVCWFTYLCLAKYLNGVSQPVALRPVGGSTQIQWVRIRLYFSWKFFMRGHYYWVLDFSYFIHSKSKSSLAFAKHFYNKKKLRPFLDVSIGNSCHVCDSIFGIFCKLPVEILKVIRWIEDFWISLLGIKLFYRVAIKIFLFFPHGE